MISVIIPLYNKEAIIERTLRSVLSQDYDDYEVIIVDDGSTDNSATIVKCFIDNLPPSKGRTGWVLIQQENGGPSKARNTGIKNAKGDWVVFLDADDEMLNNSLYIYNKYINTNKNIDIFIGEPIFFNGKTISAPWNYHTGKINNIFKEISLGRITQCTGSIIARIDICNKYFYNETLRRYEDYECLYRRYEKSRLFLIGEPVVKINSIYSSASKARNNIKEDYVGHLDFKGKGFWERMCLYQLYIGERTWYPEQIDKLYPTLKYRFDLLLLWKILRFISNKLHRCW